MIKVDFAGVMDRAHQGKRIMRCRRCRGGPESRFSLVTGVKYPPGHPNADRAQWASLLRSASALRTPVECSGALRVSRERTHREDVSSLGYFSPHPPLTVHSRSREMSYAHNTSTAVLPEFGRLRRRDACSSAKLYHVCDAGADDHLCRTRAHRNICNAAYHDGNPLALKPDSRIGAICTKHCGGHGVGGACRRQWASSGKAIHCSPC
jgi:hypothetical protein